ncbi:MAG: amidohydrolase family protein [SAR324 cluster bacterium]|nr:amidohydrolase family protein [SAR324 cluster bacterium]
MASYEGWIANHNAPNFYGTVCIDDQTGIIEKIILTPPNQGDKGCQELPKKRHIKFPKGAIIYPGFIDLHTHAREDKTQQETYKENYQSISKAALHGGVAAIGVMPNTPCPLTNQKELTWHRKKIDSLKSPISIFNYIAIAPDSKPIEGEHHYKLFVGPTIGSLFFTSAKEIENTLQHYQGQTISFHVEDYQVINDNQQQLTHQLRRPAKAVLTALDYMLELVEKYKINATFCHWPIAGESLAKIALYQKKIYPASTIKLEVTPTHLLFDADMISQNASLAPYLQLNPALQTPADRQGLIKALKNGLIDFLATDHAPHLIAEKLKNFSKFKQRYPKLDNEQIFRQLKKDDFALWKSVASLDGTSGVSWLDTFYLVVYMLKERHNFSDQDIARIAAYNPGQHLNKFLKSQYPTKDFGKGLGKVATGYYGCLSVINYDKSTTLSRENIFSKSGWSLLEGKKFNASLEAVVLGNYLFYP